MLADGHLCGESDLIWTTVQQNYSNDERELFVSSHNVQVIHSSLAARARALCSAPARHSNRIPIQPENVMCSAC